MALSLRELFSRQDMMGEVISLRHSLTNHPWGFAMGLREAHQRLTQPTSGDGFVRGCRRPDSVIIHFGLHQKPLGGALPEWVPVAGDTRLVRIRHQDGTTTTYFVPDYTGETRTVEGILTGSKVTHTDFPLQPWHTYYDWNFYIRVDPQYTYLHSDSNLQDHGGVIECEWDTAFLPSWAWPQDGDRIWMVGRWIYDCGHPEAHGHKTELHPPKAVASFRSEAVTFAGNRGPTRAHHAVLYIGRNGGYWRQPINDQDYAFDLYLPPKPYAEAEPRWTVVSQTGALPVQPHITPFPAYAPRALRVVIPLNGVEPHPEAYGAIIAGGWSDPRGTEVATVRRLRVTVERLLMDEDDLHVYIGINGRWRMWERLDGNANTLNYAVDLDLHPSDRVHITACGFEEDAIHKLMGRNTGLTWAEVSLRDNAGDNAEKIRSGFLSLGLGLIDFSGIENKRLSAFSSVHSPHPLEPVTMPSTGIGTNYRLRYRIDSR